MIQVCLPGATGDFRSQRELIAKATQGGIEESETYRDADIGQLL